MATLPFHITMTIPISDGSILFEGSSIVQKTIRHTDGAGGIEFRGDSLSPVLSDRSGFAGSIMFTGESVAQLKKIVQSTSPDNKIIFRGSSEIESGAAIKGNGRIIFYGTSDITYLVAPPVTSKKLFKVAKTNNILLRQAKIIGSPVNTGQTHSFIQDSINQKSENSKRVKDNNVKPVSTKRKIFKGDFVEADQFNSFFTDSSIDINILDIALKRLSSEINISKSEINSKTSDLLIDLKKTMDILDTFALYSSVINNNIRGVRETFKSSDSLIQSENTGSLFVDLNEGTVSLPRYATKTIDLAGASVRLSPISNGQFKEFFTAANMFDDDDITYCHYYQNGYVDKLILQAEIDLATASIINNISIIPNNFGYQSWLILDDVAVSSDGLVWHTIAKNYELRSDDQQEFSITFLPRKVAHIRFRIIQNNKDYEGNYNIGISSLRANGILYSDTGNIVIKKPIPAASIGSVALHLLDALYNEQMLQMNFQISLDGKLWHDIQPVNFNGDKPEILYINKPWSKDSINTEEKTFNNIYIKIAFSKLLVSTVLSELIGNNDTIRSEFLEFPNKTPYQIKLSGQADPKSLQIGVVSKLSLGKKENNFFLLGETSPDKKKYSFDLPFDPKGLENIVIGNIKLEKANSLSDLYDAYKIGYYVDIEKQKLFINMDDTMPSSDVKKTGDPWVILTKELAKTPEIPTNSQTTVIDTIAEMLKDQPIKMFLGYDIIDPLSNAIKLTYLSDSIKENFYIARVDINPDGSLVREQIIDIIPANTTVIKLTSVPVADTDTYLIGGYNVDFIDGAKEFEEASEFAYSIDHNRGYIHLRNAYSVDTTIQYTRNREFPISQNDYEVSSDGSEVIIGARIFDENSYYKLSYNVIFPIDAQKYTIGKDNKTIMLKDTSIINNYIGFDSLTNRLLKVTYLFKEDNSSFLKDIFKYITPILSEFSVVFSSEEL